MHSSGLRLATALGTLVCVTAAAPAALAQTHTPTTNVITVHDSVRVPGAILPPGQYRIDTVAGSNAVVLIRSTDRGHFSKYVPVTPTDRDDLGPVLSLLPPSAGKIAALETWYPQGGTTGFTFDNPNATANMLSATQLAALDKRLSVAERAVIDAQLELRRAETRRDAIRTERGVTR